MSPTGRSGYVNRAAWQTPSEIDCLPARRSPQPARPLWVIPSNRFRGAVAGLHGDLVPLRAGLGPFGRVEAEDVLGTKLVLDIGVDLPQIFGVLDVVDVSAGLVAEAAEFVA